MASALSRGGGFTDLELEAMRGYELSLKALLLSHTARAEDLQINSRGKARRRVVWDIIS